MGKKGNSGGGQSQVQVPAGIYQGAASETGLGQYATSLLNPLASMTNWAANLASGGNATPIPTSQSALGQAGPTVTFSGGPKPWTSSFNPQTGLITYTGDNPSQQFTMSITDYTPSAANAQPNAQGGGNPGAFGNIPGSTLSQWYNDYQQAQSNTSAGGVPSGSLTSESALGPFLSTTWNAIQAQEGLPAQMTPIEQQTAALNTQATNQAGSEYATGNSMLQQATTGSGLFPSQAAYVNEAKESGETGAAAELSALGLSNSTMAPQLKEQADLAAAATAGTLVQGNISAAQQEQSLGNATNNIALGAQTLEVGEQQAVYDMYAGIAQESQGFQTNLWNEAMAGYGALGSMLSTAASSYGYSLQGYASILQASQTQAQIAAQQQQAADQADASSSSALLGGLGKILGGLGGAGGAAGGSLGASLGAAGGDALASIGGTAAVTGASAAGGSSLIAGIGSALVAIFCQVAQTVYGFDNPKWEQFRAWLLLRAPLWFVRFYGRHASTVADWLQDKPVLKWCVAKAMDFLATC